MRLEEALRKVIRQFGVSVLQEKRLMFVLSDFRAFNDYPAVKQVFQSIVSDGSGKELCCLFLDDDSEGCLAYARNLKKSLAADRHFKQELADYAVDSITFALGLQASVKEPSDHGFDPMESGKGADHESAPAEKVTRRESRAEGSVPQVREPEQPRTEDARPAVRSSGLKSTARTPASPADAGAGRGSSPFRMKWLAVLVLIAGAFAFGRLGGRGSVKPEPVQVRPAEVSMAGNAAQGSSASEDRGSAGNDMQAARTADPLAGKYEYDKGWNYERGLGVRQDYAKALEWYRKAADLGNEAARTRIEAVETLISRNTEGPGQGPAGTGQVQSDAGRESEALAHGNRYFSESNFAEAAKYYRKAAELGNAAAQLALGWLYENGKGVSRNYSEAVKWYRKAAEQGEPVALGNLGHIYYSGHGVKRDYGEALKWFRKAAEQGNDAAYSWLGSMYYNGQGARRNYGEAMKWFLKAAGQGNADAQNYIGWMYQNGLGVLKDNTEALKWYRKAASGGSAAGQINLGWMYENGIGVRQDNAEALKWYRKAAAQGNADAKERASALSRSAAGAQPVQNSPQQSSYVSHHVPEYERAEMYFYGRGVAQDYAEAVRLYSKAAAEGDDRACYSLGWMYQNGLGVRQSLSEAASWYRKAAEHGNTDAHSRLISLDQTPVSYTPERSAYDRPSGSSTPRGGSYDGPSDPAGQYALGDRFFYGRGVPQDYAEAFSWYGKAAGSGNADAMYSLGWMYQNGLGVRQSYSEAVRWYREAAANGNTDAVSRLRSLDSR